VNTNHKIFCINIKYFIPNLKGATDNVKNYILLYTGNHSFYFWLDIFSFNNALYTLIGEQTMEFPKYKSHTKEYRKEYISKKKIISMVFPEEEVKTWKHELGLGTLGKLLMRAYFEGKIKLEI